MSLPNVTQCRWCYDGLFWPSLSTKYLKTMYKEGLGQSHQTDRDKEWRLLNNPVVLKLNFILTLFRSEKMNLKF